MAVVLRERLELRPSVALQKAESQLTFTRGAENHVQQGFLRPGTKSRGSLSSDFF